MFIKMIKKLKNNVKALSRRGSSLLDFVKDISENVKIKHVKFNSKQEKRNFDKDRNKSFLNNVEKGFNGLSFTSSITTRNKTFAEDKENVNQKIQSLPLRPLNYEKNTIKNYFKPVICPLKPSIPLPKFKKIEFFDEYNKKNVKMFQFEEKECQFTKSKILPKVKFMKVDNDVMTDDEQQRDAFVMMRNNLKETIKLIQENKDYLKKNLSKKIKFISHKGR